MFHLLFHFQIRIPHTFVVNIIRKFFEKFERLNLPSVTPFQRRFYIMYRSTSRRKMTVVVRSLPNRDVVTLIGWRDAISNNALLSDEIERTFSTHSVTAKRRCTDGGSHLTDTSRRLTFPRPLASKQRRHDDRA